MQKGIRAFMRLGIWVLLLLIAPRPVHAQIYESVGIRAQGMGGAFVAVADDATATWWNPAGLAGGAYFSAVLEYDRLDAPSETRVKGFSAAYPALGLSYYRLHISQMRVSGPKEQGGFVRQDQRVLSQFGASLGQSLGNHLVVASTLKLLRAGQTRGDLDVGFMARFGAARVGLAVKNLTTPSFSGSGEEVFDLGRQVRVGAAIVPSSGRGAFTVTVAADADLRTTATEGGNERHVGVGLEAWTPSGVLGIRGGVSANTIGEVRSAPSGGLSLRFRNGAYLDGERTWGTDPARRGWGLAVRVTF